MKVYYAPRIMKALQVGREAALMHLEDMSALSQRSSEKINRAYEQGRKDELLHLSQQLSKTFSVPFPSSSIADIIEQLKSAVLNKDSISLIKSLNCSVSDLYRLSKDTSKMISLYEQGLSLSGKLKLANLKLNLAISKNEISSTSKQEICQMFADYSGNLVQDPISSYIQALQQEIFEAKRKKEEIYFEEQKQDFDGFEFSDEFLGNSSMTTREMIDFKHLRQQKKMLKEKEWEKHQIALIKEKCKNKKKRLKAKQLEQIEMEKHLKKKNLEIEKERSELERMKENYYRERKRIQTNLETKTVKINDCLKEIASTMDTSDSNQKSSVIENDSYLDLSYISDLDSSFDNSVNDSDCLQRKISELESLYKVEKNSELKEKLRKELDSYKNSLINLRSSLVLKNTNSTQKRLSFINHPPDKKNLVLWVLQSKRKAFFEWA